MAAIDMWQAKDEVSGPLGPTDREVIEALQRVASASAHLTHAEQQANDARVQPTAASDERRLAIEGARAEVMWAQAAAITSRRQRQATKAVRLAEAHERAVLKRYGYASFDEYLDERNAVPTTDVHLELARREHSSALEHWLDLQGEWRVPTTIIDLTGDVPRLI
jgi:hypothetical protein